MKQSKKARIEQLEAQIREKDHKIARLEDQVADYSYKFEQMQKLTNSKPADCKMGEYCKGCAFSRTYHWYYRGSHNIETAYFCDKVDSCKHFVQRVQREE